MSHENPELIDFEISLRYHDIPADGGYHETGIVFRGIKYPGATHVCQHHGPKYKGFHCEECRVAVHKLRQIMDIVSENNQDTPMRDGT